MSRAARGHHPLPGGGSYQLRRSARARRLRLEVRADTLLVVLPKGVPEAAAHRLVAERLAWIEAAREQLRAQRAAALAAVPAWVHGVSTVLWRGQELAVGLSDTAGPAQVHWHRSGALRVQIPPGLSAAARAAALRAALRRWLREQAEILARERLPLYAERTGLEPAGFRIGDQRSRWGSCGSHGRIHLNWRLAMAPPAVLDYVLVHELCHLRHRDHSPRFWSLVSHHYPDWRSQRAWLRRHGAWLMAALGA